jgi:hypothetical protein
MMNCCGYPLKLGKSECAGDISTNWVFKATLPYIAGVCHGTIKNL